MGADEKETRFVEETGFLEALSPEDTAQLVQALGRPLPPALRVNTLKITTDEARRLWPAQYGWQVRAVPFCATGWQVTGHTQDLSQTLEYKMGFYYIQDAASMLPVELFHLDRTPPLVLDMAASPGGKTTHLTCKLQDRGLVIANDSSAGRMAALRSNLQHWGATCTVVSNYPGERFGRWFPEVFDQVLLDAPCSGESLRTAERRKSRPVSDKRREALKRQQIRLLTSAFEALKPGGQLVYATCSLHPDENEAVLEALLKAYPEQATLEAPARLLPIPAPALTSYQGHVYPPQVRRAVRLWPQIYDTSGFFAALVRKQGAVPVQRATRPQRPLREAGFQVLSQRERAAVSKHLQDFGFDLETVLERQALTLLRREALVYAVPELFLARFGDWPCMAMGLLVGEGSERDFVPSHELVTRFGAQFVGRRLRIRGEQVRTWLEGRDLRGLVCAYPARAVVLLEDERGRFLGRGKVLGKRIRNLLPKRLIY
jgi:16S rRNA (cytosine1407-C5)-methyltransferase